MRELLVESDATHTTIQNVNAYAVGELLFISFSFTAGSVHKLSAASFTPRMQF
jgi:hypothetical protein